MVHTTTKTIRIAVLAQEASQTLMTHIRPVALARGHVMDVVQLPTVELSNLFSDERIQQLLTYDVVYYRTGLLSCGAYLLESFLREHGIALVNFSYGRHPYAVQKIYQTTLVASHGFLTPKTVLDVSDSYDTLAQALGTPFIAKADVSAQGKDVHMVRSEEDFAALVPLRKEKNFFYQACIPHDFDYRVHVIDGKTVYPYRRTPPEGDFRANVSRGGSMQPIDDTSIEEASRLGEQVAALFAYDVCAIDFLPSKEDGKLYFTEINENPGWLGVTEVLGGDPSEAVVDLLEKRAARGAAS